jgi:hypothetical protein
MDGTPLTFAALDGIAFAAGRGRLGELSPGTRYQAGPLGPFMELRQLSAYGLLPQPGKAAWIELKTTASFDPTSTLLPLGGCGGLRNPLI